MSKSETIRDLVNHLIPPNAEPQATRIEKQLRDCLRGTLKECLDGLVVDFSEEWVMGSCKTSMHMRIILTPKGTVEPKEATAEITRFSGLIDEHSV